MNSSLYLPIALQLAGALVIVAEIILPSGGLLSLLAVGLFGYSLYWVFSHVSAEAGMFFVIADLILVPILIYWGLRALARSPVTLKKTLSREEGATAQSREQSAYLGRTGVAVTDLRPSGVAAIGEDRLDVVTQGEYLEKATAIVVIAVRGNQIVVEQQMPASPTTA